MRGQCACFAGRCGGRLLFAGFSCHRDLRQCSPHFFRAGLAPLPGREAGEAKVADAGADEAQGGVADLGGHAPHLAVFAFAEDDFEPTRRDAGAVADRRGTRPESLGLFDAAHVGGAGDEVAEVDAAA